MNILITAGNTQTPIDRVRCITNVFTGQTGASIARLAEQQGHRVTLLTSHPIPGTDLMTVRTFNTYDDLENELRTQLTTHDFDVVIMAAAINDYQVAGAYSLGKMTNFDPDILHFDGPLRNATKDKVSGSHRELWLRMTPLPKLIDRIRRDWKFTETLVKFKLEAGVSDEELTSIAKKSRADSDADWIVANTFEGRGEWAIILGRDDFPVRIDRPRLADELLSRIAKSRS